MRMQRHFRFHTARIRRRPVGRRIQKLSDHKKRWLSNLEEEEEEKISFVFGPPHSNPPQVCRVQRFRMGRAIHLRPPFGNTREDTCRQDECRRIRRRKLKKKNLNKKNDDSILKLSGQSSSSFFVSSDETNDWQNRNVQLITFDCDHFHFSLPSLPSIRRERKVELERGEWRRDGLYSFFRKEREGANLPQSLTKLLAKQSLFPSLV